MTNPLPIRNTDATGFLLAGGGEIDAEFAFLHAAGIKIDYYTFYGFPKSKRETFIKLAQQIDEMNIKLM
jgi:hypothetical protein